MTNVRFDQVYRSGPVADLPAKQRDPATPNEIHYV